MANDKRAHKAAKSAANSNIVQVIVNESAADGQTGPLKKQELLLSVAQATGMPKNQVRKVLDEAFGQMNTALAGGRAVRFPPLGKIKPTGAAENGRHVNARVTLIEAQANSDDNSPLEAAGE